MKKQSHVFYTNIPRIVYALTKQLLHMTMFISVTFLVNFNSSPEGGIYRERVYNKQV